MSSKLKNMWVCLDWSGRVDYTTVSCQKKSSIYKCLIDLKGVEGYMWKELKEAGWKCIKVNITFESVEK